MRDADVFVDTEIYQLGDLNHDGIVSDEDLDKLLDDEITSYDKALADVNHDDVIDDKDAELIKQRISGVIDTFPREKIIIDAANYDNNLEG